jgi:hypothetical protein
MHLRDVLWARRNVRGGYRCAPSTRQDSRRIAYAVARSGPSANPGARTRRLAALPHPLTDTPSHPLTRIASVVNHHQSVRADVHPPDPERAQNERIMHWPAQIVSHTCSVLHKPAPNRHDLHLRFKPGARRRSAETHRRAGLAPRRAHERCEPRLRCRNAGCRGWSRITRGCRRPAARAGKVASIQRITSTSCTAWALIDDRAFTSGIALPRRVSPSDNPSRRIHGMGSESLFSSLSAALPSATSGSGSASASARFWKPLRRARSDCVLIRVP